MPILARNSARPISSRLKNEAGFSLLEMLVVLSIMAIALSVVGSAMMRSIAATKFDRSADAAIASILTVRADAMLSGQARYVLPDSVSAQSRQELPRAAQRRLSVPQGWRVDGDVIKIAPSGICTGGSVRLYSETRQARDYILTPPKCAAARRVLPANG